MADPNLTIKINADGSGGEPRYIPPEDMEAALATLEEKGIAYRVMEEAEEEAAPSFLSFGKDTEEPAHAVVQEDTSLMDPGSRRLKSPEAWRQVGEEEVVMSGGDGEAEVTQTVPQFATSPEQKAHRQLRRHAQRQVNKRPSAIGFAGHGTEGLNPLVTYDHFEPSVEYIMSRTTDHDDITDLIENGEQSETALAFGDQYWKEAHDAHAKHGFAAVRVERPDESGKPRHGYDVYGQAMGILMPAIYGSDMSTSGGLGRQVMGGLAELAGSDAQKELIEMGHMRPAERLKDLSKREGMGSTIGTIGGFLAGSRSALGRGAGKAGDLITSALRAKKLGKKTASALAGAAVAVGELVGEEAIETTGETLRGAPRTVAGGTELAMTGMFGAGARLAGDVAGGIHDALRHKDAPKSAELVQQEALTGESGTTMLGGMYSGGAKRPKWLAETEGRLDDVRRSSTKAREEAIRAAEHETLAVSKSGDGLSVAEGKQGRAAAIAKAREDFPIHGGSVEEEMGKVFKPALVRLYAKDEAARKVWGDENTAFYKKNPELKVSMNPVVEALNALKAGGSTLLPARKWTAASRNRDAISEIDLPFIDTKEADVLLEKFAAMPTMNAETFDTSLQGLQDIINDRRVLGEGGMYKELERAMMEAREGFGPEWAAIKLRHQNGTIDLLNSYDAMGQRGTEKNADILTNIERGVKAMGRLGTNTLTDEAWQRIIRDEPGLMEQLRQAAATSPFAKRTDGTNIPFSMGAIAHQVRTRLDPVSGLIERTMNRAGPALATEAGTASERALSTAGGMEAQIDKVQALWSQQDKLAEEDSP